MKSTNKKGFTLVELIIVITILAILATIAFVSFQSYSADARDTKRKSNINDIVKSIELKSTQGVSLLNFVTGSGSRISGIKLAGTGVIVSDTPASTDNYNAGDVNLTTLGLGEEFKDGTTNSYKIGVTTKAGGSYQVAGRMEANSLAFVKGTFNQRKSNVNGVGFFKLGDTLTGGLNLTVSKISTDLNTLTLSDSSNTGATNAHLNVDDSAGLIAATGSTTTAVTDGGANLPY